MNRRFAELELYMLIIKILERFKLEYHGTDVGIKPKIINHDFLLISRSVRNKKQGCCSRVNVILNPYLAQEKYKRKPQLGKAPSIRSKCALLSCGVLIISSLVIPILNLQI